MFVFIDVYTPIDYDDGYEYNNDHDYIYKKGGEY